MGNYTSNAREDYQSSVIDRQLKDDARKLRRECRILVLGPGGSGKSTVMKQLEFIHKPGFTSKELMEYRSAIHCGVIVTVQSIARAMQRLQLEWTVPGHRTCAQEILNLQIEAVSDFVLTRETARKIHGLWSDPMVRRLIELHPSEFYLMDNATYFLHDLTRISASDYVPTEKDVLHARLRSTGIKETRFYMGPFLMNLIDIRGQNSERRKWIHYFERVTSILFCVALSEYDQVLPEDKNQNSLMDTLTLFDCAINSPWFRRTSFILFLNKVDLFKAKLPHSPLEKQFPEYTGGNDINKAVKHILWKFMQANRARSVVYPFITQATNTTKMQEVSQSLKEIFTRDAQPGTTSIGLL